MGLFCQKGIDATAVNEITDRADLGKGTFYRHFASKEEVMASLVEDSVDRLVERIDGYDGQAASLEDVLERLLDAHCGFFMENRDEFVLLFQGRMLLKLNRDSDGIIEQPFLRYLRDIESRLTPFVSQPIDEGKVRRLAFAVAGFASGYFSFAVIGRAAQEIERALTPLRRALVSGCLAFLTEAT